MEAEKQIASTERVREERKEMVARLFENLDKGRVTPEDAILAKEILESDPMTEQEAGVVARALRDLEKAKGLDALTREEWINLYSGDFQTAEDIFRTNGRESYWQKSLTFRHDISEFEYLVREISVTDKEVGNIKKGGLVTAGLVSLGSYEEIFMRQSRIGFLATITMTELPIAKFNCYRKVWESDDFGGSSPFKLGMSFTSLSNLENSNRIIHGNHLVLVRVRGNTAVREGDDFYDPVDDERTILFGVESWNVVEIIKIGRDKKEIRAAVGRLVKKDKVFRRVGLRR